MASDWPQYPDGDTKIVIAGEQEYKLHSSVLRRNSPILCELLRAPAPLSKRAIKKKVTTLYMLVLVENDRSAPSARRFDYILKPVNFSPEGRPLKGGPVNPFQNLNGISAPPVLKAFDDVLCALYNRPIEFDDNIAEMLDEAAQAADVAEYLQCVDIVTKPIEASLLGHGRDLFESISAKPVPWICFAYRIKSRTIFKEALVHAAGRYHSTAVQRALYNDTLPKGVAEVLHEKGKAILENSRLAVHRISAYYPSMLQRERPINRVGMEKVGRASYANDVLTWIALTAFRHWINDQMADGHCHHGQDMGYAFLRAICAGGETYLSHDTLVEFHRVFPMTDKGRACVEHRLGEIKETVKQWAVPLMENKSKLDATSDALDHFVFTHVKDSDVPWLEHKFGLGDEESHFSDAYDSDQLGNEDAMSATEATNEVEIYDSDDDDDLLPGDSA